MLDLQPIDRKQKIKRPMNSFMLYKRDKQDEIIRNNPKINYREVSKLAGEAWKREDPDIKAIYALKARNEQEDHRLKYPDYKYPSSRTKKKRQSAYTDRISAESAKIVNDPVIPFSRFDENLKKEYPSLIQLDTKNLESMVIPNSPKDRILQTLLSPIAFSFERDPALNELFSSWEFSTFASGSLTSKPAVRNNKCIGSGLMAHLPVSGYSADL
jgi:hypothetical protein